MESTEPTLHLRIEVLEYEIKKMLAKLPSREIRKLLTTEDNDIFIGMYEAELERRNRLKNYGNLGC